MSGHIESAAQIPARIGMPPHVGKYLRDEKILLHNPGCPACRRRFLGKALLEYVVAPSPQCGEKYSLFSVFPLAGSTAKAFCRLSLWSFKEKSINHFL